MVGRVQRLTESEIQRRLEVWESCGRSAQQSAEVIGINRRSMDKFLDRYATDQKIHETPMVGQLSQTSILDHGVPEKTTRYLLTCAQNNTRVHAGFWRNLTAFAEHINAEIKVSRFAYNKNVQTHSRKPGDKKETFVPAWAPEVELFASDEVERLAPTLIWCGNFQILPTATNPLSGLSDYTGPASSVIPHTKVAMQPVATPRSLPTKHLYTTGCCTLKNYIQAKAGQKAEFHHAFAALLVEVLPDGTWFARQLVANDRGSFSDHPFKVVGGQVTHDARLAAIQWGDIHVANIDPRIQQMFWGEGGVLDTLRPKKQLLHDLVDGESHNHHTQKDHHEQFRLSQAGKNCIRSEFDQARHFVDEIAYRPWCKSIVVWSNHDEFIRKYLQNTDYRQDHNNAVFILELELVAYQALSDGKTPSLFATALDSKTAQVLVDDAGNMLIEGIEIPYHGHVGAGGSRGSVQQYAKLGMKTMTGHSHAAWWMNGATSAGTCTKLDMGYNKGPSPWSHTFTALYEGGKRCQFTVDADTGRWRAGWDDVLEGT